VAAEDQLRDIDLAGYGGYRVGVGEEAIILEF
jgi:hypothetical protein